MAEQAAITQPFAQYQVVDVIFTEAHVDTDIPHTLQPPSAELVGYQVMRQSQPAQIYHDVSATRKPWADGVIRLRSNVAGAHVRLMLAVEHKDFTPDFVVPTSLQHTHDAADVVSGLVATARLGTGTASSSTFLRGDQTYAAISLSTLWPVGSIFIGAVATSPASLLGFGTWAAFGAGRVLVGRDAAQVEFDTLKETGGSKTHTLTTAEMPAHSHTQDAHNHSQNAHNHTQDAHNHSQNAHNHTQNSHNHTQDAHNHTQDSHTHPSNADSGSPKGTNTGAGSDYVSAFTRVSGATTATNQAATATNQATTATNNAETATNIAATATNQAATATNIAATATNQNTGGGGAHNNLQPYIVVYMWERTA